MLMRAFLRFCRCASDSVVLLIFGFLGKTLNALLVITLVSIIFGTGRPLMGTGLDRFVSLALEVMTGEQVSVQNVRLIWDLKAQTFEIYSGNATIGAEKNASGLSWQAVHGMFYYGFNYNRGYEITHLTVEQPVLRVVLHADKKPSFFDRRNETSPLFVLDPSVWFTSVLAKLPMRMLTVNNAQIWIFDEKMAAPLASLKEMTGTIQASAVGVNGAAAGALQVGSVAVPVQMTLSGASVGGVLPQLTVALVSAEPTAGVSTVVGSGTLTMLVDFVKRSVRVDDAQLRLAGGTLRASVAAVWDGAVHQAAITGHVALDILDFSSLRQLWPEGLAPNPRAWIFTNLDAGTIRTAHVHLGLGVHKTAAGTELTVQELKGGMRLEGFTVQYLGELPSVQQTSGNAAFDANSFDIVLDGGVCQGVRIIGGTVNFLGLDTDNQEVVIDLNLSGNLSDHMTIVNAPPLHYADIFGLDPRKITGSSETRFFTRFPPLNDLPVSQLQIDVNGQLKDVGFPVPQSAFRLQQLTGVLSVTPQGAKLNGRGLLNGIPSEVVWARDFTGKTATPETAVINAANLMPEQLLSLGINVGQSLRGVVGTTVTWKRKASGASSVALRADMLRATLEMPWIVWDKPINVPASLEANLMINGRGTQIESVVLKSGKDVLRGRGQMYDGNIQFFGTSVLQLGDTNGSLSYRIPKTGGVIILGRFKSLQLRPLEMSGGKSESDKTPQLLDIDITTDLLKTNNNTGANAHKVVFRYQRRHGQTVAANLQGSIVKNDRSFPFNAKLEQNIVSLEAKDAGSILAALGLYSNMRGGELVGTLRLGDPGTFEGTIKDFGLWRAPLLGRILSVASITAPIDLLMGEGLPVSIMTFNGRFDKSTLFLDDMKMTGSSLGFLAAGTIGLQGNELNLKGAIMPAYIVTQIIGGIPIVGDFLTNNRREGILAMRYTASGTTDNPSISVNPLTALTPGVLRGVFDWFGAPKAKQEP